MLPRLAVKSFQMGEVTIELSRICTDEGIAFSHLEIEVRDRCQLLWRLAVLPTYLYSGIGPEEHCLE